MIDEQTSTHMQSFILAATEQRAWELARRTLKGVAHPVAVEMREGGKLLAVETVGPG